MQKLSVHELLDLENDAWPELKQLLEEGSNTYTVIPAQRSKGEEAIYALQVSTKSYLGVIAYETGGVLVDHGWITLLGAETEQVVGSLISWNGLSDRPALEALEGVLVVAYDVAGGFFAMDTGKFEGSGHVYYFAPDTLEWESTELTYSEFMNWLAHGDLEQFYQTFRWQGWQNDMSQLQQGQVFAYYPPLWTKEGGGQTSQKTPVAIMEAWKIARGER
ncbi:DUF2625 family protein [Paenibacillus sp. MER 99-2]|uniref:DUF2625 family protein n=1 Tax=Paenibacillus sp. MER 99-2 TaxID=2939572 RepID=UPI00203DD12C|nr:DUF2625 family protein [Paenibacillus sp. MER 99-2]MCM3170881.1 DUF2625 domain-containing protein [Paenibacillus sp. MER 99-2]